jgi:hypothetical protein
MKFHEIFHEISLLHGMMFAREMKETEKGISGNTQEKQVKGIEGISGNTQEKQVKSIEGISGNTQEKQVKGIDTEADQN